MLYSIIIPCYRSSQTIRKVVEMTMEELKRLGISEYEFVLVDDCSPDDGATMAALLSLVRGIIPVSEPWSLQKMQDSTMQ